MLGCGHRCVVQGGSEVSQGVGVGSLVQCLGWVRGFTGCWGGVTGAVFRVGLRFHRVFRWGHWCSLHGGSEVSQGVGVGSLVQCLGWV